MNHTDQITEAIVAGAGGTFLSHVLKGYKVAMNDR